MIINNQINSLLNEFQFGNKQESYKKLIKIFKKNKNNDQLRFNIAVIEQSLNLNKEAKENYKFLINKNGNQKAMTNLYLLHLNENNFLDALEIVEKLLTSNFSSNKIINDKAFILYKLGKYEESIDICKDVLKLNHDVNFLNILGLNYLGQNKYSESEKIFKKALNIDKKNSSILNSLGRMYHEKRDSKNAEHYLLKAYKLNNNSFEIINNLAGFYREEGEYSKSIDLYLIALKINPKNPAIMGNLAKAYFDINHFDLSKKYCLEALNFNKNDSNIQKILSLIYLRQQDYKNGWKYFDGRLNLSDFTQKNSYLNNIRYKLIRKDKINKKSKILVLKEQGVGDEILYGTMYKDILEYCERVTIECDPRLKKIFCKSFAKYSKSFVDFGSISSNKQLLEKYDIVIYAGSLGKFFRNDLNDFNDGNYLIPKKELLKEFREKLNSFNEKVNIGISWRSFNNRYSNEKSLSLNDFNLIFETKNCNFINLQYGDVSKEIEIFNKKFQKNFLSIKNMDLMNDFDRLASVLKNLDLFITVSNSTAHLAGSLGVKTLLIRPSNHAKFHYWNQPGNSTPWYKSIKFLNKEEILNDKNVLEKYLDI